MFSTLGLFQKLPCPEKEYCKRPNCLFSHSPDVKETPVVHIPVDAPKPTVSPAKSVTSQPGPSILKTSVGSSSSASIPAKRSVGSALRNPGTPGTATEPPRKLQKVGTTARPVASPSASSVSAVSNSRCYLCHVVFEPA